MNKKKTKLDLWYNICDMLRLIVICALIVTLVFTFGFRRKTVVGESMYPTIKDGEQVMINVAASYLSDIKRFDIVVAQSPLKEDLWVKRVIALPNETVEYKKGKLYINDEEVEEAFLDAAYMRKAMRDYGQSVFTKDYPKHTLQKDEYLLVGDNRLNSLDSRTASVGPFRRSQIIAKGMFVYYPFGQARYVSNGK